jgi:hypothetical protein
VGVGCFRLLVGVWFVLVGVGDGRCVVGVLVLAGVVGVRARGAVWNVEVSRPLNCNIPTSNPQVAVRREHDMAAVSQSDLGALARSRPIVLGPNVRCRWLEHQG